MCVYPDELSCSFFEMFLIRYDSMIILQFS